MQMRLWLRRFICRLSYLPGRLMYYIQMTARSSTRNVVQLFSLESVQVACVVGMFILLFGSLFLWFYIRDPCHQWKIRKQLCEEYSHGLAAGSLCYDLCVERSVSMSNCLDHNAEILTFYSSDLVYRVHHHQQTEISPGPHPAAIWDGMTKDDLTKLLLDHFTVNLGRADHSRLVARVLMMTDFNSNGKLELGEVNSIWQLLQMPEHQLLLLFQDSSVMPAFNSSCGRLYSYELVKNPILYDNAQDSVLDTFISNRYRWGLPEWLQRVHISLGLLEYAAASLEENNVKFFMCNLSPKNFGYTHYYEAKVTNIVDIIPELKVKALLQRTSCQSDSDCVYGRSCQTYCNKDLGTCSGIVKHSDLVGVCKIVSDYILFDSPQEIKWNLSLLLRKCSQLVYEPQQNNTSLVYIQENIILDNLIDLLWGQLKDEPNKWLYRPTQRPY